MKRRILVLCCVLLPAWGMALTYDPGDLINAVKRSQIITGLFMERWEVVENSLSREELLAQDIEERFYYINRGGYARNVDIYLHGETITGYPVNTEYGLYELNLFRVFGSTIVRFENLVDLGITKWGLAVGAAGYRYGMYKNIVLRNNSVSPIDPGSEFEVKDYLYTQVFDDLIVLTNIFEGFGYVHVGMLFNQQIEPGGDNIVGTADDVDLSSSARFFFDTNILGFFFLNLGYNSDSDETEYVTTQIDVMELLSLFGYVKKRFLWPDIYLGYAYVDAEDSATSVIRNAHHTLFLELYYTYYNAFYIKTRIETFLGGQSQSEKDYDYKQLYGELGIRFDTFAIMDNPRAYYGSSKESLALSYYIIFGLSRLIDERSMNFGNEDSSIFGFSLGFRMNIASESFGGSLEFRINHNYSPKLYGLIEAYDHWLYELSLQVGF